MAQATKTHQQSGHELYLPVTVEERRGAGTHLGNAENINPGILLIVGLLIAFSVHTTEATARRLISVSTLGFGAPLPSAPEDVTAIVIRLVAVFLPFGLILSSVFFVCVLFKLARHRSRRRAVDYPKM